MPAILSVTASRIRDGKLPRALETYGKLKKIIERLGGKARVVSQAYGAAPLTIAFIIESAGWTEFGVLSDKADKDSELQALLAEIRANPYSDIVARAVSTELDV
jgi:hypothetical protein